MCTRAPVIAALNVLCLCVLATPRANVAAQSNAPDIPLAAGVTFVLAVHAPDPARPGSGIALGDYEMVVAIGGVTPDEMTLTTRIEAEDERKQQLNLDIERHVLMADVSAARLQILGFHTNDARTLTGTTALGPSLAVMRDLRTSGRAAYSVRNFNHLSTSRGSLTRVSDTPVPFPVLVNGRRVELPAVRVTGQLTYNGNTRPWEFHLLDHPRHPLTLRYAVGGIGEGFPFAAETTREIVRIDFGTTETAIEKGLAADCRVEVPGIYFDFNRATINPRSTATLSSIADLLTHQPAWRVTIEGHTDNVGSDAYNQGLSERRAAAVKDALVRDFGIAAARLSSAGFGETRPRESNDTIAGRARNRRVELVRDCSKGAGRK